MDNTEVKEDFEKKIIFDNIVYKVEKILGMKQDAQNYDYATVRELLIKYLNHQLNFADLIKPEEIFNIFLFKFKTVIMNEENDILACVKNTVELEENDKE